MLKKWLKFVLFSLGLFFSLVFTVNAESVNPLSHHMNDPIAGNPKGKITVVEFFDYQCSHCMTMAPVMAAIVKANPNVRVIFKDYPIRGPLSVYAARAALAANKQGKYEVFNHALLTTNLPLSESNILDIAKSTGININKLKNDMNSDSVKNQLQANIDLARELNLTGTPAFYIGKSDAKNRSHIDFVLGEMSQNDLQDAIKKVSM